MKAKLFLLTTLICLTGCSLIFGGPTATVKQFMNAAKTGDVEKMNSLFSQKAIQHTGFDKLKANNENFSQLTRTAHEAGGTYSMNSVTETKTADTARVSFVYQSAKGNDSLRMVFDLVKENGSWKIDDIGGAEKEETGNLAAPTPTATVPIELPPSLTESMPKEGETRGGGGARKPISAGVLNGKATSLPKPPYPPIARAAKASGAVNVQVTVDESGKVISATAVSGHPLLRAAAVAAARQARFTPTILSGQPVKVTGVIIYNFTEE